MRCLPEPDGVWCIHEAGLALTAHISCRDHLSSPPSPLAPCYPDCAFPWCEKLHGNIVTLRKATSSVRAAQSDRSLRMSTLGSRSSLILALFLMVDTRCANRHVDMDSSVCACPCPPRETEGGGGEGDEVLMADVVVLRRDVSLIHAF